MPLGSLKRESIQIGRDILLQLKDMINTYEQAKKDHPIIAEKIQSIYSEIVEHSNKVELL